MEIVPLGLEHEAALRDFLADFAASSEARIPAFFGDPGQSHAEIVETFARQSRGEGLEEGWVPGTTLFLVEEGRFLGVANLRHRLTENLPGSAVTWATASARPSGTRGTPPGCSRGSRRTRGRT